ncbi:carbohydrate-binding protein [Chitinophaga sp. SYP-B3965]|uniref:carbohydrate-binding protein n=1 Tax=Chitinophaga sp. SYP-B3965 TaxID=2663120 RepID=UPI001299EFFD|nr:carbohydrate-binding protein [Chitinophaga sp. SYP-B3965]MRG44322.1 carbohydrate-binding protein [Chitinophaga sp. SYP-B3965]
MKRIISATHILAAATLLLMAAGCKKNNEYRNMEPVREVKMSTYDFIVQANQTGLYDTLLHLLNKTGIAEKLKTATNTFFVPQDFSITSAMENLNFIRKKRGEAPNWTVDSVSTGVWDTLLNRYMIAGIYSLDSLKRGDGVDLLDAYQYEMSAKAISTSASGISNGGSMVIQYSDKNNSRLIKFWVSTVTESANVKTSNGMAHMLEPRHVFGFSSFLGMAYPSQRTPYYGIPFLIPGTGSVDIAYYDRGGEGVGYHDFEPANRGNGKFRFEEGVDTDVCTEGPYNIGYTFPGEWLKYTIKVEHSGIYNTYARVATPNAGCITHMEVDDVNVTGLINVPKGTGYQNWVTVKGTETYLTQGEHVVTFFCDAAGFNMCRLGFVPKFRKPFNSTPLQIPGTVPIVEWDWGGEGIGYKDADEQNKGNAKHVMRAFEGPDTELNPGEGGYNIGSLVVGEYTSYTVNIQKTGKYDIIFRIASPNTTGKVHAEIDGVNVTTVLTVPKTNAYATYADLARRDVTLTAGEHQLKVVTDAVGFNISKVIFIAK